MDLCPCARQDVPLASPQVHADALARERENYSDLDTSDPG